MCGIIGYLSINNDFDPKLFARANNLVKYRGPDSFGYITFNTNGDVLEWDDENLCDFQDNNSIGALGFRRLAILDLSPSGHQPMSDKDGKIWIIFNGEIYNYIEIKEILTQKGYYFKSTSDTEVIIYSYLEWGIDCLNYFNGMFSFSIYDINKKQIFCARDRLGIKPFYYFFDFKRFGFASEIKQLIELFGNQKMNEHLIADFIVRGSYGNYNEESYFNNIKTLEPGHFLCVAYENKGITIKNKCWWKLSNINSIEVKNENEVFEKFIELFTKSIKIRLRSDVALGTALSGGLDSSGIVGVLDKLLLGDREKIKTFTILSNDKTIEDPYFVNLLLNDINAEAYKLNFSEVAKLSTLEKLLWHQEEPIQNTTILGSMYLYQFIKQNDVTVVLDGQGADELMGGYEIAPFVLTHLDLLKNKQFNSFISSIINSAKYINQSTAITLYQLLRGTISYHIRNYPQLYNYLKYIKLNKFFKNDFRNTITKKLMVIDSSLETCDMPVSLMKKKSFQLITQTNLPGILRQVDRNSMAFSVEARLPFLDFNLVEYLYSLPEYFMVRNGTTKYVYRESLKGIIPEVVRLRKTKEGFKMPEYEFMQKNQDAIISILSENRINPFFDVEIIIRELKSTFSDRRKYDNIYFRCLIYFLWKGLFKS